MTEAATNNTDPTSKKLVAVRVAPVHYMAALLVASFLSAFLLYIGQDLYALTLLGLVWIIIPALAFTDRVAFDGRRIRRTGFVPRWWARASGQRDRIKLSDVEHVQTSILRTIKRGGNLIYVYRTSFVGKGRSFSVISSTRNYADLIELTLPRLSELILDHRSIELRDHFTDRRALKLKARAADIPSADVLETSIRDTYTRKDKSSTLPQPAPEQIDKALSLHRLANELRVTGLLPQSIEAFRRAMLLMPRNARLIFDFAQCLKSYAGSQSDRAVERKALAMMRLAERRAGDDAELLADIGEGYFQFGEWRRAGAAFRKGIERAGEQFRSLVGLAEIALHEGKIAHVIHNFAAASDLTSVPAARRWTRQEIDYFSRLNSDEEYMELEISRMNLLDTLDTVKGSALRIAVIGIPVIIIGIVAVEYMIANVGWAISLVALSVWCVVIVMSHMLSARIPYDLVEDK